MDIARFHLPFTDGGVPVVKRVVNIIENLGFAQIDHGRFERTGIPEVVFCEGKTPEQVAEIFSRLAATSGFAMATRVKPRHQKVIQKKVPETVWHERAGIMTML